MGTPMERAKARTVSARKILAELHRAGVGTIVERVAAKHRVRPEDVCGRSKSEAAVRARGAVWSALRSSGWSLRNIGDVFRRDHAGVLRAVRATEAS